KLREPSPASSSILARHSSTSCREVVSPRVSAADSWGSVGNIDAPLIELRQDVRGVLSQRMSHSLAGRFGQVSAMSARHVHAVVHSPKNRLQTAHKPLISTQKRSTNSCCVNEKNEAA